MFCRCLFCLGNPLFLYSFCSDKDLCYSVYQIFCFSPRGRRLSSLDSFIERLEFGNLRDPRSLGVLCKLDMLLELLLFVSNAVADNLCRICGHNCVGNIVTIAFCINRI